MFSAYESLLYVHSLIVGSTGARDVFLRDSRVDL